MSDDPSTPEITSGAALVANEVVSSGIRILAHLDFDNRQIANVFLTAANALSDGTAPVNDFEYDDREGVADTRPWKLDTLAENESFSKEIDRFAKRVAALRSDQEPGPSEVQKLTDLCLGVIPAFAAAQRWYREQCAEQGLEFALSQGEWRASASDEELDYEHKVVFFDQSPIARELHTLESVARDCERLALAEPVTQIQKRVEEDNLQLPPRSLRCLQQVRDVAGQYALMLEMLDRLVPGSETPRSELVTTITGDLPVKIESWLIETWLALAADAGVIELTKKRNRWQIRKRGT